MGQALDRAKNVLPRIFASRKVPPVREGASPLRDRKSQQESCGNMDAVSTPPTVAELPLPPGGNPGGAEQESAVAAQRQQAQPKPRPPSLPSGRAGQQAAPQEPEPELQGSGAPRGASSSSAGPPPPGTQLALVAPSTNTAADALVPIGIPHAAQEDTWVDAVESFEGFAPGAQLLP